MPRLVEDEPILGFVGKIPARGDFVRIGLTRDFADPWDDWQSAVIAQSRSIMGRTWLDAYLEMPVWRFILPPGFCGFRAVVGLIMPSMDKVGRYFPLTFAALVEDGTPEPDEWVGWLDAVEDLGRLALDEDAPPERLTPPPAPDDFTITALNRTTWWTDGGPRVEPVQVQLPKLPDGARFAYMLGHYAPSENGP
jgi:type VI secretion system protein ImpM